MGNKFLFIKKTFIRLWKTIFLGVRSYKLMFTFLSSALIVTANWITDFSVFHPIIFTVTGSLMISFSLQLIYEAYSRYPKPPKNLQKFSPPNSANTVWVDLDTNRIYCTRCNSYCHVANKYNEVTKISLFRALCKCAVPLEFDVPAFSQSQIDAMTPNQIFKEHETK